LFSVCQLETDVDGKQRVELIDRSNAMCKDKSGKWFSPQRFETAAEHSALVTQCFCFLNPQDVVCLVVVSAGFNETNLVFVLS
jgi:long-subunit acyl-CoA synthetase (AMP-forming)